ncbi:zinc finger protein 135-like [Odontomachus brunneus]|uniref:zinc finger protein 135-like n=1 Tax=Odontomachus brunneus TaxID=486640 RepID=UPI0013F24557|nr:zinc finger protein 135-like [Odontomachus brunneus]
MIPSTSQESAQNVSSSKISNSSVTDRPETQNVKSKMMASMEHEYPWSCSVCGKPFRHKLSFLKHRTLNECLICKICHMKFDLPEELYRHNETCRRPEYPHSKCSFGADTLMSLSEHMKSVHNTIDDLPISCDIRFKNFSRRDILKRHKETCYVDNIQSVIYDKCDCILKDKYTLQVHLRIHTKGNTLMKCSACGRNFKNKVLLEKHISLNNCLQCQICDQKFDVLEKFIRHYTMCLKPEYTCRECSYKTRTKNCLIKHMKSVHNAIDVLPIFCDICFMSFERQDNLKRHKETVHAQSIQSLKCDKCDRIFNKKRSLESHYRRKHPNADTLMKCLACGRSFKYKVSFEKHISLNNCLQCQTCDQKFDVLEKFIRHYKMCTKTEYTCRECSYKTDTKNCLIKHMKSVHNAIDVLPISCDICFKNFSRRYHLKRHKETVHVDNIQPVKCDIRGNTLKNKRTLENHLKSTRQRWTR